MVVPLLAVVAAAPAVCPAALVTRFGALPAAVRRALPGPTGTVGIADQHRLLFRRARCTGGGYTVDYQRGGPVPVEYRVTVTFEDGRAVLGPDRVLAAR